MTEEDDPEKVGDVWTFLGLDVKSRLIVSHVVGTRTEENAKKLIRQSFERSDENAPLFTSDKFTPYTQAILDSYHVEVTPPKEPGPEQKSGTGRVPLPELNYAQVVKTYARGHVVSVHRTIVFGTQAAITQRLLDDELGLEINTAYVERVNGTSRDLNRRVQRKTRGFSKEFDVHAAMIALVVVYYNFIRPHQSLRLDTGNPGRRGAPRWSPRTPAMAAGITEHPLTWLELLSTPVPPTCPVREMQP